MPDPMPIVRAYPACSKCKTAYVLRRVYKFTSGTYAWGWMRDCKCRPVAEPVIVKENG